MKPRRHAMQSETKSNQRRTRKRLYSNFVFSLFRAFVVIFISVVSVSLWQTVYAQAEIWAKITAGATRQRIRLVVANFNLPVSSQATFENIANEIKQVAVDDLEFSLYFDIVKYDTTKKYSTTEKNIDYQKWQSTGAQVLLTGNIEIKKKTMLNISLYDLFTRKLIGTKSYEIKDDLRRLSHKLADDVIKLLAGEDGISQTQIAFSLKKDRTKELAIIDYDGYNLNQITTTGELKLYPDWSPKANRIAFCSYASSNFNIYTYEINKKSTELICGKPGLNTTPSFSPDGKHIAASLTIDGTSDIFIMNVDGSTLKRITFDRSIEISPTWSPSGQEIAYVSDRTGTPQIYVINVDGTNMRRITFEGSYNTSPAWSPRGDLITYVSRESNGLNQIYVTDLTGDTRMQLTNLRNNEDPCWSADGLHLTFSSNRTGIYELYLMHWNGSGQRKITNSNGAFSPSWSPRLEK